MRPRATLGDSVRRLVQPLLADEDVQVRVGVLTTLRTSASATDVPAALSAYERASRDRENDARVAALSLIAAAWRADSARFDATLRGRVSALPVPRDSAERDQLKTVTPASAWRTAALRPDARPMAEYEALFRKYVAPGAKPVSAVIHTSQGDITIAFFAREAPLTVDNFVQLAKRGYYRDGQFHRVVPNFVAQDGDPRGDGNGGGPGYSIRDELNRRRHSRGTVAMALSGPDTGGSQYYLCHSAQPHLDGHYTVFAQISAGWDVLDRIVQGDRIVNVEIR
jgi:cyclophilin family peptidyl-prolyl cis-trans isomerase